MITGFSRPNDQSFANRDRVYDVSKALGRYFIVQHKINDCDYIVDIEKSTMEDLQKYFKRDEIHLDDLLKLAGVTLPLLRDRKRARP